MKKRTLQKIKLQKSEEKEKALPVRWDTDMVKSTIEKGGVSLVIGYKRISGSDKERKQYKYYFFSNDELNAIRIANMEETSFTNVALAGQLNKSRWSIRDRINSILQKIADDEGTRGAFEAFDNETGEINPLLKSFALHEAKLKKMFQATY